MELKVLLLVLAAFIYGMLVCQEWNRLEGRPRNFGEYVKMILCAWALIPIAYIFYSVFLMCDWIAHLSYKRKTKKSSERK